MVAFARGNIEQREIGSFLHTETGIVAMRDIVLELERGYEPLLLHIEDDTLPLVVKHESVSPPYGKSLCGAFYFHMLRGDFTEVADKFWLEFRAFVFL